MPFGAAEQQQPPKSSLNRLGRLSQLSVQKLRNFSKSKLNQIAPIGSNAEGQLKITAKMGRKFDTAGSASYFFLLPVVVWGALTISAYGASCFLLQGIDTGLREMEVTALSHATATRVRFYATQLVVAAATPGAPQALADGFRRQLASEASELLRLHSAVVHGDKALGLAGALYVSEERNSLLFGAGCLRTQEACRPASDPYFTATNYGLDSLVKAFVEQAQLFAADPAELIAADNDKFNFLWDVRARVPCFALALPVGSAPSQSPTPFCRKRYAPGGGGAWRLRPRGRFLALP